MAEDADHVTIRAFAEELEKAGVHVREAVLYGPCAKSTLLCDCEIPVIVVSEAFGGDDLADGRTVLLAAWKTDPRILPVPVHPDAWAAADDDPRLHFAKTEGRPVPLD